MRKTNVRKTEKYLLERATKLGQRINQVTAYKLAIVASAPFDLSMKCSQVSIFWKYYTVNKKMV